MFSIELAEQRKGDLEMQTNGLEAGGEQQSNTWGYNMEQSALLLRV